MTDAIDKVQGEARAAWLESALEALYRVSRVLSRSLELRETLSEVLRVLDEECGFNRALVTLTDPDGESMAISALHGVDAPIDPDIRWRAGEGVIGSVQQRSRPLVIERLADNPNYLPQRGMFDAEAPFIGVPIRAAQETIGVLALQPPVAVRDRLDDDAHFAEMVANLIGQTVRLSCQVRQERRDLSEERDSLRRTVRNHFGFDSIIGRTVVMRKVFEQIRQVAKWNTTVLVRGETGTGKELIAQAIHYNSPRAAGPFVKLNCAALPENLLESELFGHEKGAFTGALTQRKGRFEAADGGTLFLDEIGEISASFQAKLLRVLQEGELERVGGVRTLRVDVRVIAATNRDLEFEVEAGKFREDLFYRLNVMPIMLPPLRERVEDIPEIARFLVDKVSKMQGRPLSITDSALRILLHHGWPGNVRELENCVERAAVMSEDGIIDRDLILVSGVEERVTPLRGGGTVDLDDPGLDERERVIAALEQAGWVQAKAARLLNMTPRQIAYRIQTLNIKVRQI
ncbi:nif-specific transcriptional activator NifA [Azoarcus communis]|uniref:Nif-specific regulatory protein n=1 Tax=Parazoarcus communis SWub3 = DSM 12120 TaxID=1121029 RepID=A0A323UWN4_9RHOO|nr:nif-specific transcriptional activator NifA [Parazoarcus communis]NMG49369.1 nif-specific transcriptional activator NifA [Parazoarcus communis]NMG69447.1 nif-specific transcriptional activator NifA [Parazoarcus communis SWub3 = DSM 12120]PZA17392.1 nif-specific transcriptional activator NifA [Azoarcus communis] [Parazoarcus communis SWub3 = DSM 12120]